MRAVSLFSGAGGFELGLERAGIETVLQAECDPWALAVLRRHWPEVKKVDDVRAVGTRGGIDLVYGGFPCQDVSVAGKRAGLGGERSGLWFEFERVLSELRPSWCLIENVPGLLSSNGGRDFAAVLLGLEKLGFWWAYRILDAQFFGVPQRRRRVFIVGGPGRRAVEQVLALCEGCPGDSPKGGAAGQEVAFTLAASTGGTGDGHGNAWNSTYIASTLRSRQSSPGTNLPGRGGEDDANLIVSHALTAHHKRDDPQGETYVVANSLTASAGHHGHSSPRGDGSDNLIAAVDFRNVTSRTNRTRVEPGAALTLHADGQSAIVPGNVRRLTPLECERLMGWPDEHTRYRDDGKEIPDTHRYRLCGNGVVATVAEWIGHRLVLVDRMRGEVAYAG